MMGTTMTPHSKSSPLLRKNNAVLRILSGTLVDLPAPINISYLWNFGSLLGLFLVVQVITGIFLASHYVASASAAFPALVHIMQDVNMGWLFRIVHANGASFFFVCLYLHVGRGLYHRSFSYKETWNVGVLIFFLSMIIAFLGYVLPWGQMSFWGATVITNFLSAVPLVGTLLVEWIWGGFAVQSPTLSRFFMLHFCLPFVLIALVIVHIFFLHQTGSKNPLSLEGGQNVIAFHPYYTSKDGAFFWLWLAALGEVVFFSPFVLGDVENFVVANPMVTPEHIVPEWYFLFAYAVLRAIPDKLLGVIALVLSVAVLFLPPWVPLSGVEMRPHGVAFRPVGQILFWSLLGVFALLTWVGGQVVEVPFIEIGQILVGGYFASFAVLLLA